MTGQSVLKYRLASVVIVTEERGWWVKGRLRRDESIAVEMCFDNPRLDDVPMADDIPLVYLGLLASDRCLFEFQNGFVPVQPVDRRTHEDVMTIIMHVTGYRHQPTPIPRKRIDSEEIALIEPSPQESSRPQKRRKPRFYRMPLAARK